MRHGRSVNHMHIAPPHGPKRIAVQHFNHLFSEHGTIIFPNSVPKKYDGDKGKLYGVYIGTY